MEDASSEVRKRIAAAPSPGRARRPRGMSARSWARAGAGYAAHFRAMRSTKVMPGATAFTVTPRGPRSRASCRVTPSMPAFELAYWPRTTG